MIAITGRATPSPHRSGEPDQTRFTRWVLIGLACLAAGLAGGCGGDTTAPPEPTDAGRLVVSITGLPAGVDANVMVSGPAGFSRALAASDTLAGLQPGSYTVTAATVLPQQQTYVASPDSQRVGVAADGAPTLATVSYAQVTGDLTVQSTGLPNGADAVLVVTGPAGFSQVVTGAITLASIPAGTYTVTATDTVLSGHRYQPDSSTTTVAVMADALAEVVVAYSQATGSITLTIAGLPAGVDACVDVSGLMSFRRSLAVSDTLVGLEPGTYTITATSVNVSGDYYTPDITSQDVLVSAAQVVSIAIAYSIAGTVTHNLTIEGLYAMQSTQRYTGTVPLIQGRDAYLRVFVTANEANTLQPAVRVRLYEGGGMTDTFTISATLPEVPITVDQGVLASSWNVLIPGDLVQSGRSVLVDVDPGNSILETDETDNAFPASGTPLGLDVRPLPTLALRFVPVYQSSNGETGNIDLANMGEFFAQTRRMFPLAAYDLDVRSVYTTSMVAQSNGSGWGEILSELLTLRNVADESSWHYYGVVHTAYTSGVTGVGYVPYAPSAEYLVAVGWDNPEWFSETMAHEVGHNFGRSHAPCGTPSSVDPNYPHEDASIGAYGMDVESFAVKAPDVFKDIMSYCSPLWVSDYTFEGILDFRSALPATGWRTRASLVNCLLVWGRITPDAIVLEPAFEIAAVPVFPERAGRYRLEAVAVDGTRIFGHSFTGCVVADLPGGPETHFSFLIPVAEQGVQRPFTLLVSGQGMQAVRSAAEIRPGPAPFRDVTSSATVDGVNRVRIEWNAAACPMVMVRDPDSGEVLSFARGGSVSLPTLRSDLELIASDGVRSFPALVRVIDR
ncbi:MAG: zinc-dependent metalloprotease family protein [bacterium]